MYVALKTGVVDCAVYPALYAHTVSLHEVTNSASYLYPIAGLPYVLGASEKKWEKLPESYKNAVKSASEELFKRSTDYTDDEANEIEARRKLESQGVDWLVDFSASDQRAFLDAAAETWKEAANDAGGDALNNRARILKAIGR